MSRAEPRPTLLKTKRRHRTIGGSKTLCGRRDCDMFPVEVLPDERVTCPECSARLARGVA